MRTGGAGSENAPAGGAAGGAAARTWDDLGRRPARPLPSVAGWAGHLPRGAAPLAGGELDAGERDEHEDDREADGELEERALHAAPRAIDRRVGAKRSREARATALQQRYRDQGNREHDLDDFHVGCEKLHDYASLKSS